MGTLVSKQGPSLVNYISPENEEILQERGAYTASNDFIRRKD
jgi:hypothetical protein